MTGNFFIPIKHSEAYYKTGERMQILMGKNVLITGASSGIGKAIAYAFAREGASLVLIARRIDRLENIKKDLENQYQAKVHNIQIDVRDKNDVQKKLADLDKIDILVNNAGLALGLSKIHESEFQHFDDMFDTNVKGLLYVSRTVIPKMVAQNSGDIINIGSIAGHDVYPNGGVYCASKHAVKALNEGLRIDLIDTPIRVSSIDPGAVETEFSVVRFGGDKQKADNVYKGFKPLNAEDIAEIAVFITSRPAHVQISEVIVLATAQAKGTMISRKN